MARPVERPTAFIGLSMAARLWMLVVMAWFVTLAVTTPALMMVEAAIEPVLDNIPEGFEPPDGDVLIMVWRAIPEVGHPLLVAVICSMLASWTWTILWHAGVPRFLIWEGNGRASVAKILGLGLGAWWRYFRLSLASLAVLISLLISVWLAVSSGVLSAYDTMNEGRMVVFIVTGVVLSAIFKVVVWAATLRGCWELASPTARSAVMAFLRGLLGVLRQPVSTFVTMILLGVPAWVCWLLPAVLPAFIPQLRGPIAGELVAFGAGLAASFFWVALYAAFAPITGLVGVGEGE